MPSLDLLAGMESRPRRSSRGEGGLQRTGDAALGNRAHDPPHLVTASRSPRRPRVLRWSRSGEAASRSSTARSRSTRPSRSKARQRETRWPASAPPSRTATIPPLRPTRRSRAGSGKAGSSRWRIGYPPRATAAGSGRLRRRAPARQSAGASGSPGAGGSDSHHASLGSWRCLLGQRGSAEPRPGPIRAAAGPRRGSRSPRRCGTR